MNKQWALFVCKGMKRSGTVEPLGTEQAERLRVELPRLLRMARGLTDNGLNAEDLVQETVARALPHLPSVGADAGPYLRRILTNLATDHLRRSIRLRSITASLATTTESTQDDMRLSNIRFDVRDRLARLDDVTRTIIIMRYLLDLPFGEISSLVNRPPGTVRRICSQTLKALAAESPDSPTAS